MNAKLKCEISICFWILFLISVFLLSFKHFCHIQIGAYPVFASSLGLFSIVIYILFLRDEKHFSNFIIKIILPVYIYVFLVDIFSSELDIWVTLVFIFLFVFFPTINSYLKLVTSSEKFSLGMILFRYMLVIFFVFLLSNVLFLISGLLNLGDIVRIDSTEEISGSDAYFFVLATIYSTSTFDIVATGLSRFVSILVSFLGFLVNVVGIGILLNRYVLSKYSKI